MTPKQEAALRLAREALEIANSCVDGYYMEKGKTHLPDVENAITAIDEALAEQPAQQQEPVALDVTIEGDSAKLLAAMLEPVLDEEPIPIRLLVGNGHSGHGLYVAAAEYQDEGAALLVNTSPPASKPLTDEQWQVIADTQEGGGFDDFARAIEAKLKEKNS